MLDPADDARRPSALVLVNPLEAKRAFSEWRKSWARPEEISARSAAIHFSRTISGRLEASYSGGVDGVGLPLSDAAWSRWVKSPLPRKIRLDVCWQIYFMNGVDVTANKDLRSYSINSTDMAFLGPCRLEAVPGSPNDESKIFVDYIVLTSTDEKQITRAEVKSNAAGTDFGDVIGSVRYHLRNAHVEIAGVQRVMPLIKRIGEGCKEELGSSNGFSIDLDPRVAGSWRLTRPHGSDVLIGRAEDLALAIVHTTVDSNARVEVSATIAEILPEVRITGLDVSARQENKLRMQLVQQLMRYKLRSSGFPDRFIVSIAHVGR